MRHELGLDRPFAMRYGLFLWRALHGDLAGRSRRGGQWCRRSEPDCQTRVKLTAASLAVAIVIGELAGIFFATMRGSWLDTANMLGAVGALALPSFWLG